MSESSIPEYSAAVIGLGWMGMLYDLALRIPDRFDIDDAERPTPSLDIHRAFYHHDHPGDSGLPTSYAEALWNRSEISLIAGVDRDKSRLQAFSERYGIQQLYTDAAEMLSQVQPDIVAICTNAKHRSDLTCLAVEYGAKGVLTEKPMAHTLAEADRMVQVCAEANVPLCCGSITTTHPSFAQAKKLIRDGVIGEIISIEAGGPFSQHQNWSYFSDSSPLWVVGTGDAAPRESGSNEFTGSGILVMEDGLTIHFRQGAPGIRLSGSGGEIIFNYQSGWRLWQDIETLSGMQRVEMPWPKPQFFSPYGAVYCLSDVLDCLTETMIEPKNSGRRVALALEVEIALKQSSAQKGLRVDLPLVDRSLGLSYDWFR